MVNGKGETMRVLAAATDIPVARESMVNTQLERLSIAVSALQDHIASLRKRLVPVMSDGPCGGATDESPASQLCDVASRIRGSVHELEKLGEVLHQTESALEI